MHQLSQDMSSCIDECLRTPIPSAVALAGEELARRSKQRPEFGPVLLVYADQAMWPEPDCASRAVCIQCELQPNSEAAIRRASRLREGPNFLNPLILDEDDGVVWMTRELLNACDKQDQS